MGFFIDGQDPLDQPQGATSAPTAAPPAPLLRAPIGQPEPDIMGDFQTTPLADTISAAFRQANPVSSVLDALSRSSPDAAYDPTHNPLDDIRGTDLEQNHLNAFLDSPNEQTTQAIIASIRRDDTDRQTLSASGGAGTAALVAASLLDPSFYLPLVGEAREGAGIGEAIARSAGLGALQTGVSQVALHAAGADRPWTGADGVNIASNTLLMGFLGGALRMMAPKEIEDAAAALDQTRPRVTPVVDENGEAQSGYQGSADTPIPANENETSGGGMAAAAGAAAADTRQLDPLTYGLDKVPWLGRQLNKVSPNTRIFFNSDSVSAKRAMADLAENAFRFEDSEKGVPTAMGGPPVESDLRSMKNQFEIAKQQIIEENWVQHRYGNAQPNAVTLAAAKEGIGAPTVGNKLSLADFKSAMYDAGINGDAHPIPEVQTAVQQLRARVLDPIQKMAQDTLGPDGRPMLAEELQPPKGDASFMPRQWNNEALTRNYADAREDWADWLGEEQAANSATKDRISALNDRHTFLANQVDRLEGRLGTIRDRQTATGTRLDERAIEARQAVPRAENLDARATTIREGISELEEFIGSMRDGAGPEARARLSDLEGEVAKLRQEAAPMSAAELAKIEKEEVGSVLTGNARKAAEVYLGKRNAPKEPDMLAWMAQRGIQDTGGDVRALLGGRSVPGLLRKAPGSSAAPRAPDLDSWGEIFQNEFPGAFPNGRPDPQEVMQIVEGAARGEPPWWFRQELGGQDALDVNHMAEQLHSIFDELGAKPKSLREIAEGLNGLHGQEPRVLARLRDRVDAGAQLPSAEEALAGRRQEASDIRDVVSRAIKDRGKRTGALSREAARADEAGIAANRSRGRIGLLNDRLHQQQIMEDLLESARQNAADEQAAVRARLEDELKNWRGNSSNEALHSIDVRGEAERVRGLKQAAGIYEGAGDRLTGADNAVDRAVRRILDSDQERTPEELRGRAQEILNRIISSPDGRIPYDAPSGGPQIGFDPNGAQQLRGSLNAREFAIPTARVAKYVNRDIDHVVSAHLRTALPDILLTRRFGDVNMTEQFRKILDEYGAKIKPGMSEAQQKALIKARDSDIRDVAAVRDRVRGVYGWDPSPGARTFGAAIRDAQNVSALSSLGTSVFNRLTDFAANATYRYGFMNVFRDQWTPLLQAMMGQTEIARIAKQQALDAGVGADGLLGHMRNNLYDINNSYRPGNKFSRGLAWATDRSMLVNLHGPWTDWNKALAWNVAQGEFGRVAAKIAAGTASKADIARMAEASIDPAMATRISAQYEANHTLVKGRKFANVADWTDEGARRAFNAAMSREANSIVLTAGAADKPLWMSKPIWSLLGQFHSFTAAAHEKITISSLQRRDGNALQGLMMSVAMGMLSYRLYSLASGGEVSTNPADWIKEGISRSAMTGWLSDANLVSSKFTSGLVDYNRLYGATMPDTRHRDLSLADVLGGPTYARASSMLGVLDHTAGGKFSAADIHQLRMALPLQNLMFFRRALDEVEDSTAGAFGLKPRQQNAPAWAP